MTSRTEVETPSGTGPVGAIAGDDSASGSQLGGSDFESSSPAGSRRQAVALALVVAGYIVLALAYSVATPVGESPDEPTHLQYALHLLHERSLPVIPEPGETGLVQAKHPPLYYALAAALGSWADFTTLGFMPNPHFSFNFERAMVPNAFVHFEHEDFPYTAAQGFLAARIMRLLSLACGLVVVVSGYRLAELIWPKESHMAWACAGVIAFLPGFLFFSGVFNNDALANAVMALVLLTSTRLVVGADRSRDYALLGVYVGLGLITKMTTVSGVAVAGLALLVQAHRRREWRQLYSRAFLVGAPVLLLSGWWFARNLLIYGASDPLGYDRWSASVAEITRSIPLTSELGAYFWVQLTTFFARFGWEAVRLPDLLYRLLIVLVGVAALGLGIVVARRKSLSADSGWALAFVAASVGIMYLSILRLGISFNLIVAHGRYLYIAITGLALLFTSGLLAWFPRRVRPAAALAAVVGFAALSVASLFWLLIPAYETPSPIAASDLAQIDRPTDVVFDGRFRLYGFELSETRPLPGETITVTLYWGAAASRSQEPPHPIEGHIVFLHLVDYLGEVVSRVDVMPFGGVLPTSAWRTGRVYREVYEMQLSDGAVPGPASLLVGLYEAEEPFTRLEAEAAGSPIGDALRLRDIVIRSEEQLEASDQGINSRADYIGGPSPEHGAWAMLTGYEIQEIEDAWRVTLYWTSLAPFSARRTVFVHVEIEGLTQPLTGDSPPADGSYPTTIWAAGDTIIDEHLVIRAVESAGSATDVAELHPRRLLVGMYDPETGERVSAWDSSGMRWPDDAIVLPME